MNLLLAAYSICLVFMIVLTARNAYRAFFASDSQGIRMLGLLMLALMDWAFFYLLELLFPTFSLKLFSRKIFYLGMTMCAPLWFVFILRYSGRLGWWLKGGRLLWLFVPMVIVFLAGLMNELHYLVWKKIEMPPNSLGELSVEYGPIFWIGLTYSYFLITLGLILFFAAYLSTPDIVRRNTTLMFLGSLATLLVNAAYLFDYIHPQIDPTPLIFLGTASLFAAGFFRVGLLDLNPVAAPVIVENLREAVIVVDSRNRITNINSAALHWLGIDRTVVGRKVFDVLPQADIFHHYWEKETPSFLLEVNHANDMRWYDVRISHLKSNEEVLVGRTIVAHDTTEERKLIQTEIRRSEQLGLLEEVGRKIADTLNETDILQRTVDAVIERFGYAETAISIFVDNKFLEVFAISGAEDFGFRPGFRQELGSGIIGHVAEIKRTYIAERVDSDPYYFSSAERHGSAIGIPIMNNDVLLGVLYVESSERSAFDMEDTRTLETLANHVAASLQRARLFAKTQAHLRVMSTVQSISHIISSSLDLDNIFETVVRVLKESFGYSYVSIYLLDGEYLKLGAQIGYPEDTAIREIHISQGVSGRTVHTKRAQFIRDVANESTFLRAGIEINSEICVPMLKDDVVLGIINVEADSRSPLSQSDVELLTTLAGPIALSVDNARLHAHVKTVAMTDAVTGLYNRHAFEEMLQSEIYRASSVSGVFSLIIFDVDSFKQYNDAWGHPAGDERLKAIADLIRNTLRRNDVSARYGGDEFAIILPDTDATGVMKFATRLLGMAQKLTPSGAKRTEDGIPGYTLSIGIATYPDDGDTLDAILQAADQAEIRAKRNGKNQIVTANSFKK